MTMNISLVGVGGQGTLLTSDILAKVAMAAGLDVKKSEIHGMAQRGGSVISQVRFGERVCSPIIADGTSDILVSFDKLEALRWKHLVRPQARVLVNDLYLMPITVSTGQKAEKSGFMKLSRFFSFPVPVLLSSLFRLPSLPESDPAPNTVFSSKDR